MRHALIIGSAIACLGLATSALAQPSGGVGNHSGPMGTQGQAAMAAEAAAPTVEDYIDFAKTGIEKAAENHKISAHKAKLLRGRLKTVETKLEQLSHQVAEIRRSLPEE